MVRLGVVSNEKTLELFLIEHLVPSLEMQDLPYLRFAMEAAPDLSELCSLDCEIHAWKIAKETREASIQIGRRRLKALRTISDDPLLAAFEAQIEQGNAFGHHICVSAIQAVTQQFPLTAALGVYAYQSLAGACAAAPKLIRIGQDGCQRVLTKAVQQLPATLSESLPIQRERAGCFSPMLEIASMRHAYANERLFIS